MKTLSDKTLVFRSITETDYKVEVQKINKKDNSEKYTTTYEVYRFGNVNFEQRLKNGELISASIVSNKKIKGLEHSRTLASYIMDKKKFHNIIENDTFYNAWTKLIDQKVIIESTKDEGVALAKEIQENGLDPERVVFCQSYDGTFRDINGEFIDMLFFVDYIGGINFSNEKFTWKWDDLIKYLKAHPDFKNVEEEYIPYYNGGGRALSLNYILHKSVYYSIKERSSGYRDKNDVFPSKYTSVDEFEFDPFELKQFMVPKTKEEIADYDEDSL